MDILRETGLDPKYLELELTESVSLQDVDSAILKMLELRALGIALALDDFGTGYSSLSYLQRLPIDTLKIDRAFVQNIVGNDAAKSLIASVISLAHGLGLKVVTEGVETASQAAILKHLGCDELQGFLLGKPGPPEIAEGLISAQYLMPGAEAELALL